MKNNMRSLQIQTVRSIVEKLLKKKNEATYEEKEIQTLSSEEVSGNPFLRYFHSWKRSQN